MHEQTKPTDLLNKLKANKGLTLEEYQLLIEGYTSDLAEIAAKEASKVKQEIYGNKVFIRGLIEISNICKNDCYYCGIQRSNKNCERYRLREEEILECCQQGYKMGFRTFVLQGGEDGYFTDEVLCRVVSAIKMQFPDCAITLSVGERSRESYEALFFAGTDRYLLRHETADKEHYKKLHPGEMSFENRIKCLKDLKEIGFQVGCGFMVGSPYQTTKALAMDLKFIEEFRPDMCGIGPFIPHKETVFYNQGAGTLEMTCYLLSLIRLIYPSILLPATTALGTIDSRGRELGILSGANVVMPNLSPVSVRKKYELYNNKASSGTESAEGLENLKERMKRISHEVVCARGDIIK